MSFSHIDYWFLKLYKKDLSNISVAHHKENKRVCGGYSYDINHECLEYGRLPIFKHFLNRKFICFIKRPFTSKILCIMIHREYLRYNSVFKNSLEKFFNETYQVINLTGNPLCSKLSQSKFVQRTEPRSVGYDPG